MIKIFHGLIPDKGQTLVETAFALLLFLLLVLGIFEFGRAMYSKNTLTNAARAGARVAVVTPGISSPASTVLTGCSNSAYGAANGNNAVYNAVCNSLFSGIGSANVTVSLNDATSGGTPTSGDIIQVQVTWDGFTPVTGLFKKIIGSTLAANATMRYE
jgi:Flp pilus assembly protein TadG